MKRFLVFAGDHYYPHGGWSDFKGSFDTLADAMNYLCLTEVSFDWHHVIDSTNGAWAQG